jgi:hypothetical protein
VDDPELDRLLDGARNDLPSSTELAHLRERLGLPRPSPPASPTSGPWAWGAVAIGLAAALFAVTRPAPPPIVPPRADVVPAAAPAAPAAVPGAAEPTGALSPIVEASPIEASPIEASSIEPSPSEPSPNEPSPIESARPGAAASRVREASLPGTAEPAESAPSEAALVAHAAAALRRRAYADARATLSEARERYPSSLLEEERSSLEVELAIAEDPTRGVAALARFRSAFPESAHAARLDRLLHAASE